MSREPHFHNWDPGAFVGSIGRFANCRCGAQCYIGERGGIVGEEGREMVGWVWEPPHRNRKYEVEIASLGFGYVQ